MPTKNPRPWEYDDSLPEPIESEWSKIGFTVQRQDRQSVDAELIRPQSWIRQNGLRAGKLLPLNIPELQVAGFATVTFIDTCPAIASGEGSVITGRFITREIHTIARVEILGPGGNTETLEGTTIHPVWSVDRQDWVALGELAEGETLQAENGLTTVRTVALATVAMPVYNIEVHGEHVYQVGEFGLLVHNALDDCIGMLVNGLPYKLTRNKSEAVLQLKDTVLQVSGAYIDDGFLALVDDIRAIAGKTDASTIVIQDVGFGFGTIEGKAAAVRSLFERIGTVEKTGEDILGDVYRITIDLES